MNTMAKSFLTLLILACSSVAGSDSVFIGSWSVRSFPNSSGIAGIPHAGHDWAADHIYNRESLRKSDSAGSPVGIMLQNDTGPYDGNKDKDALVTVMGYVSRLDYVFADFETATTDSNILAMTALVRASTNPLVRDAYIGNYAYYPGNIDLSYHWKTADTNRTAKSDFYLSSGLNVAQPHCYPYEYFEVHASAYTWGQFVAPNKRAALFWAPLERYSVTKRALPNNHKLIPWINDFVPWTNYDAPAPSAEDCRALLKHLRMRGADGYYTLVASGETYANDSAYIIDMLDAWHSLDSCYSGADSAIILNLATSKVSGIQWSGLRKGNRARFLVSNLGGSDSRIDFPSIAGIPDSSPVVSAGMHAEFDYVLSTGIVTNRKASPAVSSHFRINHGAKGEARIVVTFKGKYSLTIHDARGRIFKKMAGNGPAEYDLQTGKASSGIYTVTGKFQGNKTVRKVFLY